MPADRKWVERNLGFDPITTPPPWSQQEQVAQIYKGYGRWSTVCSAITCWGQHRRVALGHDRGKCDAVSGEIMAKNIKPYGAPS